MLLQIDIYLEYKGDMEASGLGAEVVQFDWFAKTFRKTPELKDITISTLKRNFGRCAECVRLEAAISSARAAHDAE